MLALSKTDQSLTADTSLLVVRAAGIALLTGSVGVVLTSVAYGVSPIDAAMPVFPLDLQAAIAGAVRGRASMGLASAFGVPSDLVIAAACILLGIFDAIRGRGLAALGWFLVAISSVLFIFVDSIVGFVLPALAATGEQAFLTAKTLFNVLFLVGTVAFGIGAAATMMGQDMRTTVIPRTLRLLVVAAGVFAAVASAALLMGVNVHAHVIGAGIGLGAVLYAFVGLSLAKIKAW